MSRYRLLTGSLCLMAAVAVRGGLVLTPDAQPESDPVAYPVATNALALAEGALQAEADTLATVTARGGTTTSAVTIGYRGEGAVGVSSLANGDGVVASGAFSHAEGGETTASGYYSHAEGGGTTASGEISHAEGSDTTASGDVSHAEGSATTASGFYSHAEGFGTTASGDTSHADGFRSVASDTTSFAWQGSGGAFNEPEYGSHGHGTFNLNPVGGLAGLWIGETNMAATLSGYATTGAVAAVEAAIPDVSGFAESSWVESLPQSPYLGVVDVQCSPGTTVVEFAEASIYRVNVTNATTLAFDFSAADRTRGIPVMQVWLTYPDKDLAVTLPGTNVVTYLDGLPDIAVTVDGTRQYFSVMSPETNDAVCNLWWSRAP